MKQFNEFLFVVVFITLMALAVSLAYFVGESLELSLIYFILVILLFVLVIPSLLMSLIYSLYQKVELDLSDQNISSKKKVMFLVGTLIFTLSLMGISTSGFIYFVIL